MEEEFVKKRKCFLKQFEECRCAFSAMGDNNRQLIIRTLMEHTGEAGIIDRNEAGTRNYYFLDAKSSSIRLVADFWQTAQKMMSLCQGIKEDVHNEII